MKSEKIANGKFQKTELFKRIRLTPVFIQIVFIVFIIGWGLFILKDSTTRNLMRTKIREGYIQANENFSTLKQLSELNLESIEKVCSSTAKVDPNFRGMEVYKGDEVLYSYGMSFDVNSVEQYTEKGFYYIDSGLPPYFSTAENSALIKGQQARFNIKFTFSYLENDKNYFHTLQQGNNKNYIRDWQDIWYEEKFEDYTFYSCHKVPLTDADLQICTTTAMALHGICFWMLIVFFILVFRVINSRNRVVNAYYKDKETGGANWYYFYDYVNQKIRNFRKSEKTALFLVNLTKFNVFCSCFGEKEGDILIKEIYDELVKLIPPNTVIARHDRADFVMYLRFEDENNLIEIVNSIFTGLERIRPNTSLVFAAGVYVINKDEIYDISDAYMRAVIAAEYAERNFAKEPVFFNTEMRSEIQWEGMIETDLDRGIKLSEFEVYLQPKYSCGDERISAAEALVRWNHPTEGFLTPYKFVPVLEKTGAITKLDDYMISNVARIQSELLEKGIEPLPVSVNLSRRHFSKKDLADHVCSLVDKYNVPHNLIEIELTESSFFDNQEQIIKTAHKLQDMGFEVSLDDFGAGYSSLNSLRNIPIDIVKIDGGFFRGKDSDGKGAKIVEEIIHLAKQLNIKVVAEGIEERNQVDFVSKAGCDLIQGYYFAKPMPLSEYEKLLEKKA